MKVKAFIAPHRCETMSACQDCYAINPGTAAAAVSDGVSQSIFPLEWARILSSYYVQNGAPSESDRRRLSTVWRKEVEDYIEAEKAAGHNPWRAESSLAEGLSAGATLCGIVFWGGGQWTCDVIGDSALIQMDSESAIRILTSEDKPFDTYPDYIDSHPSRAGRGAFRSWEGVLHEGEYILLVSDPFTDYCSRLVDRGIEVVKELIAIKDMAGFYALVERLRDEGMSDDDSTAIVIEWDGNDSFEVVPTDNDHNDNSTIKEQ